MLNKTILIAYDSNGNIMNKIKTGFTLKDNILVEELETSDVAYIYNGDKLLSYGNQSITYDVLGRPTSFMGKTITWAKVNQITKIDNLEFKYDSLGRRIKKGNIDFIYDSNNRLIKQGDLEFIYDHTGLAGIINGITGYFYRKNAQGDIIALVDRSGNVVVKYVYDAWGNHKIFDNDGNEITSSTHIGVINPFRYRGYYYDEETQLYWVSSRYYSPELCRFISPDSIEYLDPESINGLNLYCYCMNNPIMYADPSGHFAISIGFLIGSILAGAVVGAGLSGVVAYSKGERGWDLAWDIIGGGIFGAATGAAMALGAAAGAGGIVKAGAEKVLELTFGKALVTATVSTAVAGGIKYSLDCIESPNQWDIKDCLSATVSGAYQGMATFGIGFLGGKNGMFSKMDSYKAFETLYGGVNMSKLQTLAYVSKLALGDTFARWTLVSGSAAIARFIISLLFGI